MWFLSDLKECKLKHWLANRIPRSIVYWSAIRVGVHATTGKYSSTVVPELTLLEALRRWEPATEKHDYSQPDKVGWRGWLQRAGKAIGFIRKDGTILWTWDAGS